MSSTINQDIASSISSARINKEKRFQIYGILALLFAIMMLFTLFFTIFSKGFSAFIQTRITLNIDLNQEVIDFEGKRNLDTLQQANYQKLIDDSLKLHSLNLLDQEEIELKNLRSILSPIAYLELRNFVIDNQDFIGKTKKISFVASDDIDQYFKGKFDMTLPENERRISDIQKIFVDDLNIDHNLEVWQKLIGYVPQDIYLLDDTIRNNIAFGLNTKDINQEAILKSIKLSRLEDYISSLEEKENTVIGNRGIKVSGGQKQRIGIARALYHDPKILILDEATSSLDTINERKIMEEIYNAAENITLIIITHRHKSVLNCDKIYLLDNGKIIDEGKFTDLEKRHSF